MSGEYTRALEDVNAKIDVITKLLKQPPALADETIRKGVTLLKQRLTLSSPVNNESTLYTIVQELMRLALERSKA